MEAIDPVRHRLKLMPGLYPELLAIYLLGFLPLWMLAEAGYLLRLDWAFDQNFSLAISMWIVKFLVLTSGIVFAAVVYRHLVISGSADDTATMFD